MGLMLTDNSPSPYKKLALKFSGDLEKKLMVLKKDLLLALKFGTIFKKSHIISPDLAQRSANYF